MIEQTRQQQQQKWVKTFSRHFTKEDTGVANKHMEKILYILCHQESEKHPEV